MATPTPYVPLVQAEAERLTQFLDTLLPDDWQRPSACALWTIRDVVAHLIWAADFYTDTVSRGIHGDISHPGDRPPGDAPASLTAMSAYFNQQAIKVRDRVGTALLPTFRSSFHSLSNVMSRLSPQQWDMPCAFFHFRGGKRPADAFLFAIIQELSIHGWDIRSRFDKTASLSEQSLPLHMERIPIRLGFVEFPMDTGHQSPVRYRFDLGGESALRYDVIVEGSKARMEPSADAPADVTLRCDRATFALLLYHRFTLDSAVAQGRLTVEGNQAHARALGQSLTAYF